MKKEARNNLRRYVVTTALATAMTGTAAVAQDPVRDRLSPGNGPDWAGEPTAETRGYTSPNQNVIPGGAIIGTHQSGPYQSGPASGIRQGRVVGPTYYRDSSGRYFYLDQNNRAVFDQTGQVIGQSTAQVYRQGTSPQNTRPQTGTTSGQDSKRPMLGVAIEDTPEGVQIAEVAGGSAAEQAGLQRGDVIIQFDGQDYSNLSSDTFTSKVGSMNPGQELSMVVMRNGQQKELTATLGGGSQDQRYQAAKPPADGSQGMSIQAIEQQLTQIQNQVERLQSNLDQMKKTQEDEANQEGSQDESKEQARQESGDESGQGEQPKNAAPDDQGSAPPEPPSDADQADADQADADQANGANEGQPTGTPAANQPAGNESDQPNP